MKLDPQQPSAPLYRIDVDESDWAQESPSDLLWMLQQMLIIRRFEEELLALKEKNLIHGPVHTSIGQEGVAAGMGCALRPHDRVSGTHRAHHQYLAKVLSAIRPAGLNPLDGLPPSMTEETTTLLKEIMGLAGGCSGGRGGSMHLFHKGAGVIGTNAIVAGGVPHATGFAWADKMQGRDSMTVCFFGDGAMYQGVLDEASNLAGLWKAPIVFFIENNQYSVGTTLDQSCSAKRLHEKALAYSMPGLQVDGMNPLAVKKALDHVRLHRDEGFLPCYIDAETYRYLHHAGNLAGSAFGYRKKDEETGWRTRDPVAQCIAALRTLGMIDDEKLRVLEEQARRMIAGAVAACTEAGPGGALIIPDRLWPAPQSIGTGMRDDRLLRTPEGVEPEDITCDDELKFSDAIAAVTGRWMERDPLVFVCGEEVANMGGGAYGATKGLPRRFPDRVRNTPISEAGFSGLACGAALNGMRPVVEIMFSSFVLVAADQLLNQIGQLGHIYGAHADVPVIVRTRIATGLGYGAQHSLDPSALFTLFPGYRVVCPTTSFDYIGLFNAAMRSRSPTLIIEHQVHYGLKGAVPRDNLDFLVAPGRARIVRAGTDVTVATYSSMATVAREAADRLAAEEGIEAEVIDLRTIDDAGMDYETIGRSLRKTGMLVTAEQAPRCNGIGGKMTTQCLQRFFDEFDGAPLNINAPDVPIAVSRRMEVLAIPSVEQTMVGIRKAARREV
jgi:2-oxoisovalerate dehydrogenase E1 component